jgi:hypothetical protein
VTPRSKAVLGTRAGRRSNDTAVAGATQRIERLRAAACAANEAVEHYANGRRAGQPVEPLLLELRDRIDRALASVWRR